MLRTCIAPSNATFSEVIQRGSRSAISTFWKAASETMRPARHDYDCMAHASHRGTNEHKGRRLRQCNGNSSHTCAQRQITTLPPFGQ